MQYISLVKCLCDYGQMIKNNKYPYDLNTAATQRTFDAFQNRELFKITRNMDTSMQTLNTLRLVNPPQFHMAYNRFEIPDSVIMPPILEIEWLRSVREFSSKILNVLEQISYNFIFHLISWRTTVFHERCLHEHKILIEVESMEDTPAIIKKIEFPCVSNIRYRTWGMELIYGMNFLQIFDQCVNHTEDIKELYMHSPILTVMFMIDYYADKLNDWSNQYKISVENKVRAMLDGLDEITVINSDHYTYGVAADFTEKDIEFMRSVFTLIYDTMHNIMKDMGTISFIEYRNVKGEAKISAEVRLSDMRIDWNSEMERAEKEKQAEKDGEEDQLLSLSDE